MIIHCDSKEQANSILQAIRNRMQEVKLRLKKRHEQFTVRTTEEKKNMTKYSLNS